MMGLSFSEEFFTGNGEADLCDGYESPVRVYIDPDQNYWLDVYED